MWLATSQTYSENWNVKKWVKKNPNPFLMLTLTQLEYWKQRPSGLTLETITHAVCLLRHLYPVVSCKFPLWITCLQSFNPAHLRPKCTGRDNSFLTHLCWFLVYKEGVSWFLIKEIEQLSARGLNYHCWPPVVSIPQRALIPPHPAPTVRSHMPYQIMLQEKCICWS